MPTKGTTPTQIRLTEDDKAKLAEIQQRMGLPSLAAAIRHCAREVHRTLFPASGKSPKKSGKRP